MPTWTIAALMTFMVIAVPLKGGDTNDPHRPPCGSAQCRKILAFLKAQYCGAPEGNGPDDGCAIRSIKKKRPNLKVTADFECEWDKGVRHCEQHGQPSAKLRSTLLGELRRLGLPAKGSAEVYFTVWQPTGLHWSLAEAYYDELRGSEVSLCQTIVIVDQKSQVFVLRKVRFQKADADKNNITTWSLLDVTDVNGDGQVDVILQGDAYEDHWIEVDSMRDKSWHTIFSGLGYYL
jgi:hypothetical protein